MSERGRPSVVAQRSKQEAEHRENQVRKQVSFAVGSKAEYGALFIPMLSSELLIN